MSDIYSFCEIFFSQWWWLMGVPSAFAAIISWWCPTRSKNFVKIFSLRNPFGLSVFCFAIFLSGFFAWREEHHKFMKTEKELANIQPSNQISELKSKIERLNDSKKPRIIDKEQKKNLLKLFRENKELLMKVKVCSIQNDEANNYAMQFMTLLRKAGIDNPFVKLKAPEQVEIDQYFVAGVFVAVKDRDKPSYGARILATIINKTKIGFGGYVQMRTAYNNDYICLLIAKKEAYD